VSSVFRRRDHSGANAGDDLALFLPGEDIGKDRSEDLPCGLDCPGRQVRKLRRLSGCAKRIIGRNLRKGARGRLEIWPGVRCAVGRQVGVELGNVPTSFWDTISWAIALRLWPWLMSQERNAIPHPVLSGF